MICWDMSHNLGVPLAREGADLLVTVSAWPSIGGGLYETYTKGNALQAQRWHIVSNQLGFVGHVTDYGHSRIVDPNGNIVTDTGQNEGMVIAETGLLIDTLLLNIISVSPSQDIATTWGRIKSTN